jgi:hypothetical protein
MGILGQRMPTNMMGFTKILKIQVVTASSENIEAKAMP